MTTAVNYYSVSKKLVHTYNTDYFGTYVVEPTFSYDMDTMFDKSELDYHKCKYEDHKIIRLNLNGEQVFAAFDDNILEMIGCLESQKNNEISIAVRQHIERLDSFRLKINELNEIVDDYKALSLWGKIKVAFKK